MSPPARTVAVSLPTITSSCTPQKEYEELSPHKYAVPLFSVPAEEAHPNCASETIRCNYYSDYGLVVVFKCHNSQNQPRIYTSELNSDKKKPWYKRKLRRDINNDTFSEYCKSTFDNYKWFMEETKLR